MEAIKNTAIAILLLAQSVVALGAPSVIPTTITSQEIIATTSTAMENPLCLEWCFTGICVWLACAGPICETETSPRYKHYNPDLVVTVYDELGHDPWVEMNEWYASIQLEAANTIMGFLTPIPIIAGGSSTEGEAAGDLNDMSRRFKEASAYGHPMSALGDYLSDYALCPSEADAYYPYFLSGVDSAEWRFGVGEMLYVPWLLPGVRTVGIGGFFQQWGHVFPRIGFVTQKDDPKAGAIAAQRVGNIVTGSLGFHLANQFNGNGYSWTVLSGELIENIPLTGKWQMLKPIPDPICYVFGENDVLSPVPWSFGRSTDDNGYAYTLWRRYECCRQKGSLITVIPAYVCM